MTYCKYGLLCVLAYSYKVRFTDLIFGNEQ